MSEVPDMKQAFLASRIFEGTTRDYRSNTALLLEGLQIVALVPQSQVPAEYQAVDLGPLSVLPGLIDCHVHLVGAAMGDSGEFDQPFRDPLWAGFLS